jgi:tetratricopeptide (TPR) repeat protein
MNALEIAEILCPNYFYIPYTRADILAYKGKKKEALVILERIIARDPDVDNQIPENHAFVRMAKTLYKDIKNGK